jgi:hypothetical protein
MKTSSLFQPYVRNVKSFLPVLCSISFLFILAGCGIYSFKDISIDYSKIKTIRISYIENRAKYVTPQLSSKLTDKIQQQIGSQTKLIRTNSDDAHLQISGTITDYSVSTTAISATQATSNRLTVTVHMTEKNTVENKTTEFDVSRNFDFSANLSLADAETQLMDQIVNNLSDDIFNHIFSNW